MALPEGIDLDFPRFSPPGKGTLPCVVLKISVSRLLVSRYVFF